MSAQKLSLWWLILVLITGVLAVSTASIFIRLALAAANTQTIGFSLVLAASRLALATVLLLPAWNQVRQTPLQSGALRYAGLAGICLALHFATWITSLSYTSITASTTLVTTNPIWVALISHFWLNEKIPPLAWSGIGIALAGGILIGFGDASTAAPGSFPLLGDVLALVGAWAVSLYFLLGREAQHRNLSLGSYSAVSCSTAAVLLLPLPLLFGGRYTGYPSQVYLYILLLALLPQLVGHTSFNWAMRRMAPVWVTLAILFEPVCASILGYLIFEESPAPMVWIGASILLTGVAVAALGAKRAAA